MESLQLKRTWKNPTGNEISNIELKDGEALIAKKASDIFHQQSYIGEKEYDPEQGVSYLFIGDGISKVSELLYSGNFTRISNRQIPADNSVSTASIQTGAITSDKLAFSLVTHEEIDALQLSLENELNNKSQIVKTYFIINGEDNTYDFTLKLKSLKSADIYPGTQDPCSIFDLDDMNGLTLVVNFLYAPLVDASRPITVTLVNGDDDPIYYKTINGDYGKMENKMVLINNKSISEDSRYCWSESSTVTLVFDTTTTSFNLADTDILKTLAQWCADNDKTYINGGMIATGTITANQIKAGSITADKIAAGSISSGMLDPSLSTYFDKVLESSDTINDMLTDFNSSNRTAFIEDPETTTSSTKTLTITDDQAKILLQGHTSNNGNVYSAVRIGANMLVRFNSSYSGSTLKIALKNKDGSIKTDYIDVVTGSLDKDNTQQYGTDISEFSWVKSDDGTKDDNYRLFTFTGSNWIITKPASTALGLAQECHLRGLTYIKGGTVLTGRVVADEIEANSITASKINIGSVIDNINEEQAGKISGIAIADGTIAAEKILSNSITSDQIHANAITSDCIAAGAITADKLAVGISDSVASVVARSSILSDAIKGTIIEEGVITTNEIEAIQIRADQITSGTITTAFIDFSYSFKEDGKSRFLGIRKAKGNNGVRETYGMAMYSSGAKLIDDDTDIIAETGATRLFLSDSGIKMLVASSIENPKTIEFGIWSNVLNIRNMMAIDETTDAGKASIINLNDGDVFMGKPVDITSEGTTKKIAPLYVRWSV